MSEYIGLAFFLFIGVAALLLLFIPLRKLLRRFFWARVPATILNTEIVHEIVGRFPMSGRMVATVGYVPKISYQYQVGKDQYESQSVVDPTEETVWFDTKEKAERFIDSIADDRTMEAFYAPRNPRKSVLVNRLRPADSVGLVAGAAISFLSLFLVITLWPDRAAELDFPLYENAEVYAYPDEDAARKYWTLTSSDDVDDVTAFYDANVGNGWRASQGWQPGLAGSVFRIWNRVSIENGDREEVTVRVQKEKDLVRRGLELSIGYRKEPSDEG